MEGLEVAGWPRSRRAARPWTAARIQTGVGPVEVRRAKVRDRADVAAEEKIRFTSSILPKWARRTKSLDALLPILYLRGVSTGDFQEALAALLGKDAPNLSPAVIARLTAEWQAEYDAWQKRDLSARRYVYVWADGVYLQARMEESAECMLVLIGATPEGKKELVGFQTGVRESAQSWRELLIDIKRRGLEIAPDLAVGDGALGFWKALDEVFPATRHQRCWVHKTANILDKVALSVQANMKKDLLGGLGAKPSFGRSSIDVFAEKYGAKYDTADQVPGGRARHTACASTTSRPSIGTTSEKTKSHRERVRDSPAQDGAHEGLVVVNDCQINGVQAATTPHRRPGGG